MGQLVRWVVQSNLGSAKDVKAIAAACSELQLPCTLVESIPFSEDLPDVPTDLPAIFYGSSNFVTNVYRSRRWWPGAFFDEETFRYSIAMARYGAHMLNSSATITTMEAFSTQKVPPEQEFFIRPDGDLKEFAGAVYSFQDFQEWCERLRPGGFTLELSTPIMVATPIDIDHEWRLFLVESHVVSGSHYRARGDLDISQWLPTEVADFAEAIAGMWSPALAFVLDIAEVEGKLRVLEVNGFNSSGFYANDIRRIVQRVSEAVDSSNGMHVQKR
jgi:hypothetical protein